MEIRAFIVEKWRLVVVESQIECDSTLPDKQAKCPMLLVFAPVLKFPLK